MTLTISCGKMQNFTIHRNLFRDIFIPCVIETRPPSFELRYDLTCNNKIYLKLCMKS